jgi:hypothetical protein
VTGAHRSGTTWVGKMLASAPGVGYIHEPFSPVTAPGITRAPFEVYFQYVCAENEAPYRSGLERTLDFRYDVGAQLRALHGVRDAARSVKDYAAFTRARLRHARPLLKDPIAVFSSEWLASAFGAEVVFLVRHPAAFASSLKRFGWSHRFDTTLEQPLLLRDHLAPFEEEIRRQAAEPGDIVSQAILLWRMIYGTGLTFLERHPDWTFVRHEDLSRDPVTEFRGIFDRVELEFDGGAERAIRSHSADANPSEAQSRHAVRVDSGANVSSWKRRLSPDEIERIRTGVADVSPTFYADDEW